MINLANLTRSIKVNLSEEQYKNIRKLAQEQHESVASLIREALKDIIQKKSCYSESKIFREHEAFGIWSDRDDMNDSSEWVRKQREKWHERLSRSE